MSCRGKSYGRRDHGALPETGGRNKRQQRTTAKKRTFGTAKNGTSRSPMTTAPALRFTGFIAMQSQDSGLPMPATTDDSHVHRTAHSVGIQLPRRSVGSRGVGRGVPLPSNASDGVARPGWRLWRRTFLSGHEEARPEGAYRSRDHFPSSAGGASR